MKYEEFIASARREYLPRLRAAKLKYSEIVGELRKILDLAVSQDRDLSANENKRVAVLKDQKDAAQRQLEAVESEDPLFNDPEISICTEDQKREYERNAKMKNQNGYAKSKDYRSLFNSGKKELRDDGFGSFGEFLQAVVGRQIDPRLVEEARALGEGTGSLGGFLVPEQYSQFLLDASLDLEIVRPRARVFPMTSNLRNIPGYDDADKSNGTTHGGFSVQWLAEGGAASTSDAKFRNVELNARRLALYTKASLELTQDAPDFSSVIGQALVEAVAFGLDNAFLNGDGAGKPRGVLKDAALIVAAKGGGQSADTITYQNLVNMYARLAPKFESNAVWVAHPNTKPQLMTLTFAGSNSDMFYPVLQESSGVYRIFGKEVLFSEKMQPLGNQGDILLADFSQYGIGLRKEISIDQSDAVYWSTHERGYRAIVRADGMGLHKNALTPLTGGSTLSWAITLEAR